MPEKEYFEKSTCIDALCTGKYDTGRAETQLYYGKGNRAMHDMRRRVEMVRTVSGATGTVWTQGISWRRTSEGAYIAHWRGVALLLRRACTHHVRAPALVTLYLHDTSCHCRDSAVIIKESENPEQERALRELERRVREQCEGVRFETLTPAAPHQEAFLFQKLLDGETRDDK